MEKELNIAAILKDKPDVILYDLIHNRNVKFDKVCVSGNDTVIWCDNYLRNPKESICVFCYSERGTIKGYLDGLQILKPSKDMQDWSKFDWKKGDVLKTDVEEPCYTIFSSFQGEYTEFCSRYYYCGGERWLDFGGINSTNQFVKASDDEAKEFIKKVEEHYGGKLNLSTLEIEQPKQEFNDGDVLFVKTSDNEEVFIKKLNPKEKTAYYVSYNLTLKDFGCQWCKAVCREQNIKELRLATDSEKQQLFDALAKENKAWDAEKKMLVDLPKKCEFETMDWCLMRDHREKWKLCQFGFFDKGDEYEASYNAVGGNWYNECIPYNDQTAHLLGTTNEWKGGER